MKRKQTFVFVFILIVIFCSCDRYPNQYRKEEKYDRKTQTYDEGYEEIEHKIIDEYGAYIHLSLSGDGCSITLGLKSAYFENEDTCKKVPVYKIADDVRVMVNSYLRDNPDSLLSQNLQGQIGMILLIMPQQDHDIALFQIDSLKGYDTNLDAGYISYETIDLGDVPDYFFDDNFPDSMYEYLAENGEDIVHIDIPYKGIGQNEKEQVEWETHIKSMFPRIAESLS
ncbi:MAG: hypothetical protein J6U23_12435 [Clostridiales bacterium]|nr:hypothetical protein [Clostridiales bacterium]